MSGVQLIETKYSSLALNSVVSQRYFFVMHGIR